MKFEFIAKHEGQYSVAFLCRRLKVSRSGYYAWSQRSVSERTKQDALLAVQIRAYHRRSGGTYGSPRIVDDLREDGFHVGRHRVMRLMRQEGLWGRMLKRFKKTTDSSHDLTVAENHLNQRFVADAPNRIWVTDITCIRTWEGWLYLAVILDLFSRRVVGYAMADHMRTELCLEALDKAAVQRQPQRGWLHHSDRGSQYASFAYQEKLEALGALCSMSGKGNCYDNAVAESFFATLKQDLIYRNTWPTRRRAMEAISDYIDHFYNVRRRHSTLGSISPVEYELRMMQQHRLAA